MMDDEQDSAGLDLEDLEALEDEAELEISESKLLRDDMPSVSHLPPIPDHPDTGLHGTMSTSALNTVWSFGMSSQVSALNLSDGQRSAVMYPCSHVGIIHDFESNRQYILQGHMNCISCTYLSEDKRWLITGDKGSDATVIAWDTYTGIPIQTIFDPNPDGGFESVALSSTGSYLATLSAGHPQILAVWDWTVDGDQPKCSVELKEEHSPQHHIMFCGDDFHFVVSTGPNQVVFLHWTGKSVEFFAPLIERSISKLPVGYFTQSLFQRRSTQALTATTTGQLILWVNNPNIIPAIEGNHTADKAAIKMTPIQNRSIDIVTIFDKYIVVAGQEGLVTFLDKDLMMVHWFQLGLGPITSLSFSLCEHDDRLSTATWGQEEMPEWMKEESELQRTLSVAHGVREFEIGDYIVTSANSIMVFFTNSGNTRKVIQRGFDSAVHALSTHPFKPYVAIGCHSGFLQVWNYETKEVEASGTFGQDEHTGVQTCSFDPKGIYLALGMTSGSVLVLDAISLKVDSDHEFHVANFAITHLVFSYDSQYMATADARFTTSLYRTERGERGEVFQYLGRYQAHFRPICDIMFGQHMDTGKPRLISISADRRLVEYNLEKSRKDDLVVAHWDRLEQSAIPCCMAWYPAHISKESFMITANDQYKLKLYNATTRMCRKTLLGPMYGSPLQQLLVVPRKGGEEAGCYGAFATVDKIGLFIFPVDGNPHKSMALIGHPNGLSKMAVSHCGCYLFTVGGTERTAHMWEININALEAQAKLGGEGLTPFYHLLEGGREGSFFADMEDYFYYAQMRKQGPNSADTRLTTTSMPLSELPDLMRALGFYPTEHEIEDMLNEVKFSRYLETGQLVHELDIGQLIQLYINHRPAFGLSLDKVKWAFDVLGVPSPTGSTIAREDMLDMLQNRGEHMTEYELADCLDTLLQIGLRPEGITDKKHRAPVNPTAAATLIDRFLPHRITASSFIRDILSMDTQEQLKKEKMKDQEQDGPPSLSSEVCGPSTLPV